MFHLLRDFRRSDRASAPIPAYGLSCRHGSDNASSCLQSNVPRCSAPQEAERRAVPRNNRSSDVVNGSPSRSVFWFVRECSAGFGFRASADTQESGCSEHSDAPDTALPLPEEYTPLFRRLHTDRADNLPAPARSEYEPRFWFCVSGG